MSSTQIKQVETQDYHVTLTVDATPQDVFNHIISVTKWWTEELDGKSQYPDDEFEVRFFGDVHVPKQKLIEVIPYKKIVWEVTGSALNFIKDKHEWTGTTIHFEISANGNQTQLDFIHKGLVPAIECYADCTKGWDHYIKGSLYKLLTEGKGTPEVKQLAE